MTLETKRTHARDYHKECPCVLAYQGLAFLQGMVNAWHAQFCKSCLCTLKQGRGVFENTNRSNLSYCT
jgi:hypothetical protein